MSEDSRQRAEAIFQDAMDQPPQARERFVEQACAGDEDLRADVQSLLRHFDMAGDDFLAHPAFDPKLSRDFEIPERIGKYRIVGRIGEGGMGVVFEAEQDTPRRRVALKVIRPGLHRPEVRRRFEYESEILARLHHPCIAHVYEAGVVEVGREEGIAIPLPYFAMELVRGPSIDRWVRERGLSTRAIVELMATVADAVEAAHQRGVIHRDLKPANVVVSDEGRPKVLDFGLARAIDTSYRRSLQTGAGTIVGTLPYASPEQLWGDPDAIDMRTDVYSLGMLLLELLIGTPPIDVGDLPLPEAIRRLREEPLPRPSRLNRGVNDELETIVNRATDRDRNRRYPSAGALAADLRRYLRREPIEAKRDSGWYLARTQIRRYRAAFVAAVAFLALLMAAAFVGFALYVRANVAREDATERLWEAQLQQARAARESEVIGRRARGLLALAAAAEIRPDRALRDEAIACLALDDLALEREVSYEGVSASTRGLVRIDRYADLRADGQILVRTLAEDATIAEIPADPAYAMPPEWVLFDPAGRRLAVRHLEGQQSRLAIWDLEPPQMLLAFDSGQHTGRCFEFTRGADGSDLLVMALQAGLLRVIELPGGAIRAETSVRPNPVRLALDPGGRRVSISYHNTGAIDLYEVEKLVPIVALQNEASGFALTFAGSGRRVVAGGSDFFVRIFDIDDPTPRIVLRGHQSSVIEAGVIRGTNVVVTQAWDQTTRFWDHERGREIFSPVKSMRFNAVADRLVLRTPDERLAVWRYEGSREFITLTADGDFGAPTNGRLFDRGTRLVTGGANGVLEWELESGTLRRTLDTVPARDVIVDATRRVAVATTRQGVIEYDLRDTDPVRSRVLVDEAGFEGIAVHPEGWIAAGRQVVAIFDETGIRRRLPNPAGANAPHVSTDGRWTFIGTWHGDPARVIDNTTLQTVFEYAGSDVRGGFDPRGRWLALVDGRSLRLVATQTWREVFRCERGFPGNDLAGPIAFSPDGSLLAATLDNYRLELFETHRFEPIATLANPDFTAISKLHFSEDGQRLLVLGTGTRAHVWDLGRVRTELRRLGLDWTLVEAAGGR